MKGIDIRIRCISKILRKPVAYEDTIHFELVYEDTIHFELV